MSEDVIVIWSVPATATRVFGAVTVPRVRTWAKTRSPVATPVRLVTFLVPATRVVLPRAMAPS